MTDWSHYRTVSPPVNSNECHHPTSVPDRNFLDRCCLLNPFSRHSKLELYTACNFERFHIKFNQVTRAGYISSTIEVKHSAIFGGALHTG